uniref:SGNH hydrolase-type esterase domain-containing protein n=1 Tax=viral metagenome TaxID=1070528 RepID=A0A6C0ET02_9ZZZZ
MIKILVLGDSHGEVFNYCNEKQQNIYFEAVIVGGATAQGSVNPNSITNALNVFKEKLNDIKNNNFKYIIINLGEVDCGFVIWYRKNKYNIGIEDQLKITTDNLFNFINLEILPHFESSKIIINGSVLPTIKDNTDKKYLIGARSEIVVSQIDRTELTIKYNNILKNYSLINGYNYMDITNYILDNETKVVNTIFLNKNIFDHHLDNENTYNLWLCELYKIIGI